MALHKPVLISMDEHYIRKLAKEDPEALIKLSLSLIDDLKGALEREEQSPKNSSRPSASQPPWDKNESDTDQDPPEGSGKHPGAPPPDQAENNNTDNSETDNNHQNKGSHVARKPGKQTGSKGFGRTQKLPITDTVDHQFEQCQGCGCRLAAKQTASTGFYSIDVVFGNTENPGLVMSNTLHRYYQTDCPGCGLLNQSLPERGAPDRLDWLGVGLTQWRLIGPSLAALIVYLSMDMRLTRRQIKRFLSDLLGLELSVGSIQNCKIEAARALAPVEEQLVEELLNSDLIYVDETSHPEAGTLLWLWVFISEHTCVFQIGNRSAEIFNNLLTSGSLFFTGWIMSDGYKVYRDAEKRLRCWAHVYRKGTGLSECYTPASRHYGKAFLRHLDTLMQGVYQAREGPDKGEISITKNQQQTLDELELLCQKMKRSKHEKTRALGVEMLNDWEAFMRVLDNPCWPLTNNEAERALRHWVILRRITYGTRSAQGSRALALFASIISTCRLRHCSPLLFIRDVICARRDGQEAPLMPQYAQVIRTQS